MTSKVTACPHCGVDPAVVYISGSARGPVEFFFDEQGRKCDTFTDRVRYELYTKEPVIRCGDCKKIRRDYRFSNYGEEPRPEDKTVEPVEKEQE